MSNILLSAKSSRQSSYAEVPVSVTAPESYGGQHLPFSSGSVMTSAAAQHVGSSLAGGSTAVVASSTGQALKVLERVLAGRKVRDTCASNEVCHTFLSVESACKWDNTGSASGSGQGGLFCLAQLLIEGLACCSHPV